MNKSLILAALLLPSSVYSVNKEQQIKQLKNQIHEIKVEITQLHEGLAYEALLTFIGGKDESLAQTIVRELRKKQKDLLKAQKQLLKLGVKDVEINSDPCCCPETCNSCCEETK